MKNVALFLLVVALALSAAPRGVAVAQSMETAVKLAAQNGSGEDGSAMITAMGDNQIKVTIQVANGTATPQPAHIHKGTCANLDPVPAFPLNNVVNGMSETVVIVGLAELAKGGYAINIHKSAAEVSTYVSCGDIVVTSPGGTTGGNTGGQTGGSTPGNLPDQIMTVKLAEQNNSGEYGGARITWVSDTQVRVEVTVVGGSATPQPAHIHKGTCANLDPVPAFPLNNVVNGMSDTTVNVGMAELAKGGYAINIHKSAAEVSTYVSCGNIEPLTVVAPPPGGTGGQGGSPGMPTTGNGDQINLLLALTLLALLIMGAGLTLVRRRA
jgi:hypothetical protein